MPIASGSDPWSGAWSRLESRSLFISPTRAGNLVCRGAAVELLTIAWPSPPPVNAGCSLPDGSRGRDLGSRPPGDSGWLPGGDADVQGQDPVVYAVRHGQKLPEVRALG